MTKKDNHNSEAEEQLTLTMMDNTAVAEPDAGTDHEDSTLLNDDHTNDDTMEARSNDDENKIMSKLIMSKLNNISARLDRIEAALGITTCTTDDTANTSSAATVITSTNITAITNKPTKSKMKTTIPWTHHPNGQHLPSPTSHSSSPTQSSTNEVNLHFYDNEYHCLPQHWVLPRLSFEGLMVYWFLGDPSNGVPPLIKVGGTEFKNIQRGVRKRSDMKYLMKHVERKGREENCYMDHVKDWTPDNVRLLFDQTNKYFDYPNRNSPHTKFDKLSWETVCHNVRRNKGVLVGEELPSPSTLISVTEDTVGNTGENAVTGTSIAPLEDDNDDTAAVATAAALTIAVSNNANDVQMTDVSAVIPESKEEGTKAHEVEL